MSWEEFNPDDSPGAPEYDHVAIRYWDLVQVRYHMLRALKLVRNGPDDYNCSKLTDEQRLETAIRELEDGQKLNNRLLNGATHIVEVG